MIGWKRVFEGFKFLMISVYLVLGVVILFTDILLLPISDSWRTAFGLLLIVYGSFRIYSWYLLNKRKSDEM